MCSTETLKFHELSSEQCILSQEGARAFLEDLSAHEAQTEH